MSGLADAVENPALATSVGLLLHGFRQQYEGGYQVPMSHDAEGVWNRMKKWFNGNF